MIPSYEKEFIRFVIFGGLALVRTLLELILWRYILSSTQKNKVLLKKLHSFNLNEFGFAQAVSFVASVIISYFLNRYITFSDSVGTWWLTLFNFLIVSVVSLVASVWITEWLTTNKKILDWSKKYPLLAKHWPLCVKLAAVLVSTVTNYLGYRFIVFKV